VTHILQITPVDHDAELDRLASRYRSANRGAVQVLNAVGGQAEMLLDQMPDPVRRGLTTAIEDALHLCISAAGRSRRVVPDQGDWLNRAAATAMGAVGGAGGLASSLVELPMTTTLLFRSIQEVAARYGFDPAAETTKFDTLRVFAAAGPLCHDDGADTVFLTARLSITGPMISGMIRKVAPRLSVVLGQKLGTQLVPVLGAIAGATTNYIYARYYVQIACVQFGLRRLALDTGLPDNELVARLRDRM